MKKVHYKIGQWRIYNESHYYFYGLPYMTANGSALASGREIGIRPPITPVDCTCRDFATSRYPLNQNIGNILSGHNYNKLQSRSLILEKVCPKLSLSKVDFTFTPLKKNLGPSFCASVTVS